MKTTTGHLILTLLSPITLLGLVGCATAVGKQSATVATSTTYAAVFQVPPPLSEIKGFTKEFCESTQSKMWDKSSQPFMKKNVCSSLENWRLVQAFATGYFLKPDLVYVLVPISMDVSYGDILKLSAQHLDGVQITPDVAVQIARKAQAATLETGCYVESNLSYDHTKAQLDPLLYGVVCDGWDYRSLLKKTVQKDNS